MQPPKRHWFFLQTLIVPILFAPTSAWADAQPAATVNGTLAKIDGIPVLRVWGTPQERAYAHGYLLADEIAAMVGGYLSEGPLGGSLERYRKETLSKLGLMKIDPGFEAELRALLAGIEARLGGPMDVPFLGRAFEYDDLLAINCTGDFARMGCSSFAAWGEMTEDGHTIAGRNMDWPVIPALVDTQIVVVNVPTPESGRLGTVSITWPTYIGCLTGMNAEGVTVATHDASGSGRSLTRGFTPYGLTYRTALESARAESAVEDVAGIIRDAVTIVGNNMPVNRPYTGTSPGMFVFEFDGNLSDGQGLTIRQPEQTDSYLACTNHFRKRAQPIPCNRYAGLSRTLERIARSNGKRHVGLKRAWKMLSGVSAQNGLTYHSAVFEPNKRLMHVAFTNGKKNAPSCKKVTLDVAKLLAGE